MEIPTSNVNLCLVGGVSTGKSTVLNSLFLQTLSPSSKQRTTMVPTVYVETEANTVDTAAIYAAVEQKNRDLLEKSSKGVPPQVADYAEMVFPVGQLDISLACDCCFNIYDIPGLNDARTKNLYYEYLRANFSKFNVVVLLVDVQSGINTSDEMDILKFVVGETVRHGAARKIRTIVLANKCDDMQQNEGALIIEGELKTMFDQVVDTVARAFEAAGISDNLIGVAPLCALDAYLYRMIRKHGADFQLSPEQILKIGVNESGKKFSKLSRAKQEKEVAEIVQKESFLDDMISLSGFAGFELMLKNHLTGSYKTDQIANILATLAPFNVDAEIAPYMNMPPGLFCSVPPGFPWTAVKAHLAAYERLDAIDESVYQEKVQELFEKLKSHVYKPGAWCGARHPIVAFDKFREFVEQHFPIHAPEPGTYPAFICEEVEKHLAAVPFKGFGQLDFFPIMKEIGRLNRETVTAYIQTRFLGGDFHVYEPLAHGNVNPWGQDKHDKLVETLVEIERVLDACETTVQVARHFWATYIIHVQRDCQERFMRLVLHLSESSDQNTTAILLQDDKPPCHVAKILCKTVDFKELRLDGRFKLDFYLLDLQQRCKRNSVTV